MSKNIRATQGPFGTAAGANSYTQFGALAASYPTVPTQYTGSSITPALVQGIAAFINGWFSAVVAGNAPSIQDMNALFYLTFYQLTSLMQMGIPEWDPGTTYYKGAIVSANLFTFTITSASATVGATYTDSTNSMTFTVLGTVSSGTKLLCSGTGSPGASGTLTKVTGTGTTPITYSAVSFNGNVQYESLADAQSGEVVSNSTYWTSRDGKVVVSTATGSVVSGANMILVSGNNTQTLPDATLCLGQGFEFVKTDSDATVVTFDTVGGQTISGVASGSLSFTEQYSFYKFRSDGSNWWIVSAG